VQQVTLQNPNVVTTKQGKRGTWTMVYDEGFEVTIDGRTLFAFSNFTFETDPKTEVKHNVTHCAQTMVGWYRNTDRTEFGCYYGVKANSKDATAPPVNSSAQKPVQKPAQADTTKLNHAAMAKKVAKLNAKLSMLQMGWKARTMPKWIGKTMGEINSYAGLARNTPIREVRKNMINQRAPGQRQKSFLQKRSRAVKLPESFDWSNVSGVDWLEPVMDQGSCGSCYAASSMRMLSVRHKIRLNDPEAIPFSINAPLHCGEYTQGCKGGYGSLIAKWGEDVGLVPATCMRYNTEGTCKLECDLKKLEGFVLLGAVLTQQIAELR
jgi:cathepsin C